MDVLTGTASFICVQPHETNGRYPSAQQIESEVVMRKHSSCFLFSFAPSAYLISSQRNRHATPSFQSRNTVCGETPSGSGRLLTLPAEIPQRDHPCPPPAPDWQARPKRR